MTPPHGPASDPAPEPASDPAPDPAVTPRTADEHERRRLRRRTRGLDEASRDEAKREREHEDRVLARITAQWLQLREERRHVEALPASVSTSGGSNFNRAQVPWAVDLAAAWGWRLLVIAASGYLILWLVAYFSLITLPVAIALLLAALTNPVAQGLRRVGVPRSLAAVIVVVGLLGFVGMLLTFAGQQVASGAQDLADSTVRGLDQVREWLKEGPLHASETQINSYIQQAQDAITKQSSGDWLGQATQVGSALGQVLAAFFIVLFATYFFLADGDRIWSWLVRLAPRAARQRVDSSGRVAWVSLTQFVRATVIVAAVDALGIMLGAAVLQVPFVLAIGVLVFIGSFVPLIGATVAGAVAVLVALVDQGPLTALIMLGVVIGVQQIEGQVLQPFLMGRFVSLHPLGIIVALTAGVLVAGIAGALVAVPLAAAANAVAEHLAAHTAVGDDPAEELTEDYEVMQSVEPVDDIDDVTGPAPAESQADDQR